MRWVVVGGGVAGCIVAAKLSDRPDFDVVLLAAGDDHGARPVPGDVGPFFGDRHRIRVETVVRRPGAGSEPYRQGFGLGGSSLINGGLLGPGPTGSLPSEEPWSIGAVGRALLASDAAAVPVRLARVGRIRMTVADAYLRPVLERPNLTIRTGAEVERVVLDGRRAIGVVSRSGEVVTGDRIVLSAGAIRTPTVLLRSGIDTPGVGEGLQDHPAFTISLRLRPTSVDGSTRSDTVDGPMISVLASHDDHQILALDHLPAAPGLGALTVGLLRVRSRGRVSLPDRDGPPVIELQQLTDPLDRDRLCRAVERTLDLLRHPAWERVVDEVYLDDAGTLASSVDGGTGRLCDWITDHLGGHHHVSGTCAEGVVTDAGAVRGYEALYVCDASSFAGVPVGNPFGLLVELAERTVSTWTARDRTDRTDPE